VQACTGANQHAMEGVRSFTAASVDDHPHGERRAIFARLERAQIVGYALWKHRDHAIGKVDRVAACQCIAVEGRAWTHVVRDVCDGDVDNKAARIAAFSVRVRR